MKRERDNDKESTKTTHKETPRKLKKSLGNSNININGNRNTVVSYNNGGNNGYYTGVSCVGNGNKVVTYNGCNVYNAASFSYVGGGNGYGSTSVSYVGGGNGASRITTRVTGSNGYTYEEFKEADFSTRQATHRVSRGIRNKGHSVTRKLKSDGHVDTVETLHNLKLDEVPDFEEEWTENAEKHLPAWNTSVSGFCIKKPKQTKRSYKKK